LVNRYNGSTERLCTAGQTMLSGNGCIPACDEGYNVNGVTRCVKGALTEVASCESSASVPVPAPSQPPASTPTPEPTPEPTSSSSAAEVFRVQLPKSPSGMFYYPLQGLLYVLCGTSTNADHYLYAFYLSYKGLLIYPNRVSCVFICWT